MALYEEISSNFDFLGIRATEKVIAKCKCHYFLGYRITKCIFKTINFIGVEICNNQHVTAEELVDQWCAYTASNLHGAEPTVEALETMERKEYSKLKNMSTKSTSYTLSEDLHSTEEMYPIFTRNFLRYT